VPVLVIVERAHRGAVEQRYAHVLWLMEALHQQHPTAVLLRGHAVGYAVQTPPPPPLRLGPGEVEHLPDYRDTMARLRSAGVRLLVSGSSLDVLGLAGRPLIEGVETVDDAGAVAVCAEYDHIWYL
jgi:intracellular sulfur oxidation DsrE/DsrF family protein